MRALKRALLKNIGKSTKINMQPVLPGDGKIKTRLVIVPKVSLSEESKKIFDIGKQHKYLFDSSF